MSSDPLPISLVAHYVFCPRRAWLEAHGERTDTRQMAIGDADHRAADDSSSSRTARRRAVEVESPQLGIVGRCDTIEVEESGALVVVEHKANPVRRRGDVTEPQRIQLALQAHCLREAGHEVAGAAVWFTQTRERADVALTPSLAAAAVDAVDRTRRTLARQRPPAPLDDDHRCRRCSHVEVCLPDEHRVRLPARRIAVGDPRGKVLHLSTPGSRASLSRGQVLIGSRDQETRVPFAQIEAVVVHGNADVSSALIRELLWHSRPIVWCSWSGRVVGWAESASRPNGETRTRQWRLTEGVRLGVARSIVAGKIRNQRYVHRRYQLDGRAELGQLARAALAAPSIRECFATEGRAARVYFDQISGAVNPTWANARGRTRAPARDPLNAALNVAYGLLLADVLRAVVACGMDPSEGVLHTSGRNKPALALDLMEEFRPLIADSAVLWAINNRELKDTSFRRDLDAVRMTPPGRKALIGTYERRVQSEFVHPLFGYKVTWRRAMEIQARLLLAVFAGERSIYEPVVMR